MKISFAVLVLPALVFAMPEKRFLLNDLLNLVNSDTIKQDLQLMVDLVGSNATEQSCEQAGHKYLTGLLDHSVPLICHSFQELVHYFNIVPDTTTVAPAKRLLLDSFNSDALIKDLQLIVDKAGSDLSEQACEAACAQYLTGLLSYASAPICHS